MINLVKKEGIREHESQGRVQQAHKRPSKIQQKDRDDLDES